MDDYNILVLLIDRWKKLNGEIFELNDINKMLNNIYFLIF